MKRSEYKVITDVTQEPVSLAEAKLHLRLSSDTFSSDIQTEQSIAPGSHEVIADYGLEGTAVDVLDYLSVVSLNAGACGAGGSIDAKIQESDDNVIWQDYDGGSFTQITEENDNAVYEKDYAGGKQYIRVVATIGAAACEFSAEVITKTGDMVEDSLIEEWITAARERCEDITGRAFATKTIEMLMDSFPSKNYFELPCPPLQSVTSIKYKNSAGIETTMELDTDYLVDMDSNVARIVLPYGASWPSFTPYTVHPIRVRIVTGYNDENSIPKKGKQAIKLIVGHWYDNREEVKTGAINMTKRIEEGAKSLLHTMKVWWF